MPGTARRADLLHLHANVSRRVRNLETGVHPTSTEDSLADIIPFTEVVLSVNFNHSGSSTASPATLQWQRRAGIITLAGGVEPGIGAGWADVPAEALVGTLPPEARPVTELLLIGAVTGAPWIFQYRAHTNGQIVMTKPSGVVGVTDPDCRFEGANWTVT